MRMVILFLISSFIHVSTIAQNLKDTIEVRNEGTTVYRQHRVRMNARDLLRITKPNKEAQQEMKLAKINKDISSILAFGGAMLTSYSIVSLISTRYINWGITGPGIGLLFLAMPFDIAYNKRATNAVRIYNDGLRNSSPNKVYFNLGITPAGMGVCMTF